MASSNYIKNVAIVGAGGNSGRHMTEHLLSTGKHTITALTRHDSTSTFPPKITTRTINYADKSTIVSALQGQDALIITLSGFATKETQTALFEAAIEAGVPWVLPNEWSPDTANEGLVKDVPMFATKPKAREELLALGKGKVSYIGLSTGFWYEWSLPSAHAFGFDFAKREVLFFNEGKTKISVSTWPQVGRAVAGLMSLPMKKEEGGEGMCLEDLKNKQVYVNSFTISQKDMFESVLRVTETHESDWKVSYEPIKQRFTDGVEAMKRGERIGFGKMMYGRVFFPDGSGDFETHKGTINEALGLPKEDIDEFTRIAIERSKTVPNWAQQKKEAPEHLQKLAKE